MIISAGYRIGPFEVESALVSHAAVAEAAVVGAPDEERGAVVRAVVVLRDGFAPSPDLAAELQDHVKRETAPYKYPRVVDFATELPKTASGKVRRRSAARPVAVAAAPPMRVPDRRPRPRAPPHVTTLSPYTPTTHRHPPSPPPSAPLPSSSRRPPRPLTPLPPRPPPPLPPTCRPSHTPPAPPTRRQGVPGGAGPSAAQRADAERHRAGPVP